MKWSSQAERALSKVPFFVRKRVRKRVEEHAEKCGSTEVTLEHVQECKQRFLNNMEQEIKGYRVETCFGPGGCPNSNFPQNRLADRIHKLLDQSNLLDLLKKRVQGPLKFHHEFVVSVSDCANACSRPQIVDVGLIGAVEPALSLDPCTRCEACVSVCSEAVIELPNNASCPVINYEKCVLCGQCVRSCPTSTLVPGVNGYRILLGGKLGRHPQLGTELPGLYSEDQAVRILEACILHFTRENTRGERFGDILNRTGIDPLAPNLES